MIRYHESIFAVLSIFCRKRIYIEMENKRILKNASWIVMGRLFQMVLSLLTGIITARYLGPSNYGLINYSASYIAFFSAICTLGLDSIIVNEVIEHSENEEEIVSTIVFLRVLAGAVSIVLVQGVVIFTNPNQEILYNVNLIQSLQLLFAAFNTFSYWLQSRLESKITSLVQSFAYFVVFIYKVVILIARKSVIWFAMSNTLDLIIIAVILFAIYLKKGKRFKLDLKLVKPLIDKGKPFLFSAVMLVVYQQTDKLMLGKMLNTSAVGLYSAALRLCDIYAFIPVAIIDTLRPVIVSEKKKSNIQYGNRLIQAYGSLIWISLMCCSFVSVFSKLGMLLVYGESYIEASKTLTIAIWYTGFSYIGGINNIWLICENKQRYVAVTTFVGAISNVLMNAVLVPAWGINGAALATLFTQVFSNIVLCFFIEDMRPILKYIFSGFDIRKVLNMWRGRF